MSLKGFVNNHTDWTEFVDYLDSVIQKRQKTLETAADDLTIKRMQGRIAELRELKQLRDTLNAR